MRNCILAVGACCFAASAAPPPQSEAATISHAARPQAEDWVLANRRLRAVLRPDSLTLSVEDLATHETWSADPWENSAGRIHLRGKTGESTIVSLSAAAEKKIAAMPPAVPGGQELDISLARFRSRMGPVRSDRDPGEPLSLKLEISLAPDSPELTFRIGELRNGSLYWKVEAIEWPMRMFPVRTVDDDGYIVFPQEQGLIVPSRFQEGYFRYLNWIWERIAGYSSILEQSSMPWFGARKGQSSFLCIVETPGDVAYGVIANDVRTPDQPPAPPSAIPNATTALFAPRLSVVWPYWKSVKGELGYARVARYIFQPRGGYVEMCKTYRKYSQKTGTFFTLKQKIAANPEVAKIVGAPNFEVQVVSNRPRNPQFLTLSGAPLDGAHGLQTSFQQIENIVRDMKDNLGIDRALIRIAGWGLKGYDNVRPIDAASSVNEEAGGEAALVKAIQVTKDAGYLAGLWDNYRNLDLNSAGYDEKYIARDEMGALLPGFSSESGPSEEICPTEGVKLFQHNMEFYRRALHPDMIYLDTIGGLSLIECYDPRHPLTRIGTREARLKIMQVATGAGMVLGAEGAPQDWNLKEAAYYDEHAGRMGIDVPLYSMVYHECAQLYHQHGDPFNYGMDQYGNVRGTWPVKFLRALLYGDQSSWTISNRAYWAWRETLKEINDVLAPHQRRLAHEELLSHRFLTPDFLVQSTTFSSGVRVTVNYGEFPFKMADKTELPAYGYRVEDSSPNGHSFSGRVSTGLVSGAQINPR
ncbi:MAG: DUF5696 domain-containing protein [Bryobacteraceae bacterium]